VLQSFAQVADTLSAIDHDSNAAAAMIRADEDAQTAYRLVSANHQAGLAGDSDLLSSEAQARQARIDLLSAQAARLQDCVALFTALGGGWWT
jgi:outer membrane protein TolC